MSGDTLADALAVVQPPPLVPVGGGSITGMPGSPESIPTRLIAGAGSGTDIKHATADVIDPPKITGKSLASLEDLAHAYPGLADPQSNWVVKVVRVSPKQRGGLMVGGDQGNFPRFHDGRDLLTVDGFRDFFGGGKYNVIVYGPSEADPGVLRRHHDIDLPIPDLNMTQTAAAPAGTSPFANQAAVERAKQEGSLAQTVVGALLPHALGQGGNHGGGGGGDGVAHIATAAMQQSANMAQQQASLAQQQLEAERQRADRLEQQMLAIQQKINEQQHQNPVDRMAEVMFNGRYAQQESERLRQDFESRIARLREDYEARIERMRTDHANEVERNRVYAGQMHAAERDRISHENQMLRSEITRERERADTTFTERLRMEQQRFEQQANSMQSDHARAIEAARNDAKRNEDALRRDAERDLRMLENSHNVALEALKRELDRARADLAEAKMNLKSAEERIAREINKPFPVQIAELAKGAELLGMVPRDQQGPAETPAWQDRLLKMGETIIKAGAPMAMGMLSQRMQGGAGPAAPPGGGGMTPNGQPPPAALNPAQRQQQQQPDDGQRRRRAVRVPVGEISDRDDGIRVMEPIESGNMSQYSRPDAPPQPPPVADLPVPTPPPTSVSPPAPAAVAQTASPDQAAMQAKANALRASIRTTGPAPVPEAAIPELVRDLASSCTSAYYNPGGSVSAEDFAARMKGAVNTSNPGLLPKILGWVDSDNACRMLQLATLGAAPPVDWSLEGPRQWLADVWAALA